MDLLCIRNKKVWTLNGAYILVGTFFFYFYSEKNKIIKKGEFV